MDALDLEDPLPSAVVETYLLGRIEFQRALALQQRLVSEIGSRDDGQIALLLCEHPPVITVGRAGSPAEILTESQLLRTRQIEVCWVNRGGGCLLHCPGQLAIYPIVPLRWHGFQVGEYLQRLQAGILETLDDLNIRGHFHAGQHDIWGRTGRLAALGVAVRDWVTYYGAYLNVCPPMGLFRLVQSDPLGHSRPSCLVTERGGGVRMAAVRAALVRHLTKALGCGRYHLYTGHPRLPAEVPSPSGRGLG
jgi:lipoyl(octanoyl) transferase